MLWPDKTPMRQRRCPDNALSGCPSSAFRCIGARGPPLDRLIPARRTFRPQAKLGRSRWRIARVGVPSPQTDDVVAMIRAGVGRTRTRVGCGAERQAQNPVMSYFRKSTISPLASACQISAHSLRSIASMSESDLRRFHLCAALGSTPPCHRPSSGDITASAVSDFTNFIFPCELFERNQPVTAWMN